MGQDNNEELWCDANLDAIVEWVEGAYPEEGCGLILERAEGGYEVRTLENLANQYHEMDPETYPRTAREFYVINPMEFMKAEERGDRVAVVFHSHADVGDYFSDEDVAAATMPRNSEDEPYEEAHPGVDWLVVSVRDGEADHATLFEFDADDRDEPFPPVLEIAIDEDGYEISGVGG